MILASVKYSSLYLDFADSSSADIHFHAPIETDGFDTKRSDFEVWPTDRNGDTDWESERLMASA